MSSISNERSSDEVARRNIEELKSREAENNKKHAIEMRRVTEQFNREIESLKAEHQKQMDEMRTRSSQNLTERDVAYQGQMEKLRQMFTDQMRKKSEDFQMQKNQMEYAYKTDFEKQREINEQQRELVTEQFNNTLEQKDKSFSEYAENSRVKADTDRRENLEKLKAAQQKERDQIFKAHEEKVIGLNRDIKNIKQNRDTQINQLKTQADYERDRIMANQKEQLENERRVNQAAIQTMGDSYNTEQKISKAKFREALDATKLENEENTLEFQKKISDKMNAKIASLEGNLKVQKDLNVIDSTNRKRIADNQIKNIIAENQEQIKSYERDRGEAIKNANSIVGKEVQKAVRTKDDIIRMQNLEHAEARDFEKTNHQKQVFEMTQDYENELGHVKNRAETQVQKNEQATKNLAERQMRYYTDSVDKLKENYSSELNAERQRATRERLETEARLNKKAKDSEQYLQRQLELKDLNYTAKIDQVKDAYEKEIRRLETENKLKSKDQEKAARSTVENTKLKYEDQIAQMREVHEKEVDRIEQRHKEELNDLVQKMSYNNRKA